MNDQNYKALKMTVFKQNCIFLCTLERSKFAAGMLSKVISSDFTFRYQILQVGRGQKKFKGSTKKVYDLTWNGPNRFFDT